MASVADMKAKDKRRARRDRKSAKKRKDAVNVEVQEQEMEQEAPAATCECPAREVEVEDYTVSPHDQEIQPHATAEGEQCEYGDHVTEQEMAEEAAEDDEGVEYEPTPSRDPSVPPVMVKFDRKALQDVLKVASEIAVTANTMPILGTVRIFAEGKEATIYATDVEMIWRRIISCDTLEAVDTCIPVKLLLAEVRALNEDIATVELAVTDVNASVNGRAQLFTLHPELFPTVPQFEGQFVGIPEFSTKLKRVLPAVGNSATRRYLNGVMVDCKRGGMAATDSFRLHIETIPKTKGGPQILIPSKAATLAVRYKAAGDLNIGKEHASFWVMGGELVVRLIDDKFPDYKKIIPATTKMTASVSTSELLAAIEGATPLSPSKALRFTINGKLAIESFSPQSGDYRWELACVTTKKAKDPDFVFGMNAAYLLAAVKAYQQDRTTFGINGHEDVFVINGNALVMPHRV